jgi:hypothetical protein
MVNGALRHGFSSLLWIVVLYLFVFQPPFISRSMYGVASVFTIGLALLLSPNRYVALVQKFRIELFLVFVITLYCLLRDTVVGQQVYSGRALSVLVQVFLTPLALLSIKFYKGGHQFELDSSLLFNTVLLATLTPALLFGIESLSDFYNAIIIESSGPDVAKRIVRGIGVSENLTFSFSIILGIFLTLIVKGFGGLKWFILIPLIVIVLFGIVINARIGLAPVIIFMIIAMIRRPIITSSFLGGLSIIIALFLSSIIVTDIGDNVLWVTSIFSDFYLILTGNLDQVSSNSSIKVLMTESIIIPDGFFALMFGSGQNLFLESVNNSDIGFITQLNYGGLIFTIILGSLYCIFSLRIIRLGFLSSDLRIIWLLLLLLINFKGSVFSSIPVTRIFALVYFYLLLLPQSGPQKKKIHGYT